MWFLVILVIFCFYSPAWACTLYGGNGSVIAGGGSIIGKNRDYQLEPQEWRINRKGPYSYYGLFSQNRLGRWILRCGVNEKGLAVVSAMASCLPKEERRLGKSIAVQSHLLR